MKSFFRCFIRVAALITALAVLWEMNFVSATAKDDSTAADVGRNDKMEDVEEVIRDGFYKFEDSIDISEYSISPLELADIFSYILKDDPYLFFVDRSMAYSFVPGGSVLCLKPTYRLEGRDAFDAWELCRDYIRDVARLAMEKGSEVERVLFLHDYICKEFSYDESFLYADMYEMIKNGVGTCQAYTDLYVALLRECGIESHFVASDTIAHIWNYVKVDGEWYHSDATWDDLLDGFQHRHFLMSDLAAVDKGHVDWYSPVDVICDSEKYDGTADINGILHDKYKDGDVDHDGVCDLYDLLLLRKRIEKKEQTFLCERCADVTGDGIVDLKDIEALRKITVTNK